MKETLCVWCDEKTISQLSMDEHGGTCVVYDIA